MLDTGIGEDRRIQQATDIFKSDAKVCVQFVVPSDTCSGTECCMWNTVPATAGHKSVHSWPASSCYLVPGSHLSMAPSALPSNSLREVALAKNLRHLLAEASKAPKFDDSRCLAMWQHTLEAVAQLPACDYVLCNAVSGLGSQVEALSKDPAHPDMLRQQVTNIVAAWRCIQDTDAQRWAAVPAV